MENKTTEDKKVFWCDKHSMEYTGICWGCINDFGYFD